MRAIFYLVGGRRARNVFEAWSAGLARHGVGLACRREEERCGVEADVSIHYGLWGTLRTLHREAETAGAKAVLCDLGYWERTVPSKLNGHHRVSVNALHPTAYFQRVRHEPERWRSLGIVAKSPRMGGSHVLLCGMSEKAAWVYGLGPEEWERSAARALAAATGREVWYRPKPSWKKASPIANTIWRGDGAERRQPIERELEDAWAVVTHHGNAALDALVAGVPAFCAEGIALPLAERDLSLIERPRALDPAARDQLLADAAYCQWTVAEIADGKAWMHLREEGLLC